MILAWLVELLTGFVSAILSAVTSVIPPPPPTLLDVLSQWDSVIYWIHSFDAWLPLDVALYAAGAVLTSYLVAYAVQGLRMLLSIITLGGGAT